MNTPCLPFKGAFPSHPSSWIDLPFANSEMHFCHSINRNCTPPPPHNPSRISIDLGGRDEDEERDVEHLLHRGASGCIQGFGHIFLKVRLGGLYCNMQSH